MNANESDKKKEEKRKIKEKIHPFVETYWIFYTYNQGIIYEYRAVYLSDVVARIISAYYN